VGTAHGLRDRADDSLLTLMGEIPELIRNLVIAEVDAGKAWVRRAAKDAGIGAGALAVALFFLFWAMGVLVAFTIIGLSSWWPTWLAALVVFVVLIAATVVCVAFGIHRFRRVARAQNPVQAMVRDVQEVRNGY
jgi:hypothetical protein